jgi:hypothetical protein
VHRPKSSNFNCINCSSSFEIFCLLNESVRTKLLHKTIRRPPSSSNWSSPPFFTNSHSLFLGSCLGAASWFQNRHKRKLDFASTYKTVQTGGSCSDFCVKLSSHSGRPKPRCPSESKIPSARPKVPRIESWRVRMASHRAVKNRLGKRRSKTVGVQSTRGTARV